MKHSRPYFAILILSLLPACGSLDGSGAGGGSGITLLIQSPDESASGTAKALSSSEVSQSKAASTASYSQCTLTASGSNSASSTVSVPSGASQIEADLVVPLGSNYTLCAECLDGDKTVNSVGAGIRGCASNVTITAGTEEVAISALFLNLASRSSGDVRYCRVKQDNKTQMKIVCGFNGTLTAAQKLTAQCNLEFDTSLSDGVPETVSAGRSSGFVSGTKGNPYFVLGPGQSGQIDPGCHKYDTNGTKNIRGTGAWGTDADGNSTIECALGVRQMESIASGRKARFAAACTKNGSSWVAIPPSGMAEFNTSKGGNEDVVALAALNAGCSANVGCDSGFCSTNSVCLSAGMKKIVYSSTRALDGTNSANLNNAENIWVMNEDGSSNTAVTTMTASGVDNFKSSFSPDGTKIVHDSKRALDGTDAAGANSAQNIWLTNTDGSGATPLTRLTAATVYCSNVSVSPDGTKALYNSIRAVDGTDAVNTNNTDNIWVINIDGSGNTALTNLTADNADSALPRWSPNGSKIVYDSQRALNGSNAANSNNVYNVWVMNADGSGATALTRLTAAVGDSLTRPQWSPDGTKIAFESTGALDGSDAANTNDAENIWIINADGTGATPLSRLTVSGVTISSPQWSPDSAKIVYTSQAAIDGSDALSTNSVRNVWVVNADGTDRTALTTLTASDIGNNTPHWYPDGSKIGFDSSRALDGTDAFNGVRNIWVMDADGANQIPLTSLTAAGTITRSTTPIWSP